MGTGYRENPPSGQLADECEVELYQHTDELIDAFRKARDFARFIEQTEGTPQKLCFANYDDWAKP